jgi:hypothetical protein
MDCFSLLLTIVRDDANNAGRWVKFMCCSWRWNALGESFYKQRNERIQTTAQILTLS